MVDTKEIFINCSLNETRIAMIENEKLVEMYLERPDNERSIGNIYGGFIENIVPGINSVFIDIGERMNGFSHLGEFRNDLIPEEILNGQYIFNSMDETIKPLQIDKADKKLSKGDRVLVQVIKESISIKGPRVTSNVTIPGRYVVLIPNDRGVKISKKIRNISERRRLKRIVRNLIPDNFGVIVRTAAENKETDAFAQDIISTYNIWKKVVKDFKKAEKPTLLYKDYDMAASIVRDLFNEDIKRIVIDSRELFTAIKEYVNNVAPDLVDRVELYTEGEPIFDRYYNINKEYYISLSREVFLKRGGSIVIDHTEALVAIDVNSKRYIRKKSHEENSVNLNIAAAREIARQLRLRDLGGLIVVDFIDMNDNENKMRVFNEMRNALRRDRAKTSIEPISKFGLIEMTRQRLKPSIVQTVYEKCPTCNGKGIIKSSESVAISIDRWLKNYRFSTNKTEVDIKLSHDLYSYLTSGDRNRITEYMIKHWMKINLSEDENLSSNYFKCYTSGTDEDITKEFMN